MRKVKRPTTRNATGLLVLMVGLLQPLAGSAQDDPCEPPTDKKVVKLLADAEKARTAPEHHQKLKEALEEDPDRAEILFKLGVSAYRQLRDSPRASFAPALKYFDKLEETCPGHHIDVYYYTGLMHYSQGEYAEAAKAFQAFQRFPSDDPSKLGKDVDKKSADVEEVMPELAFYTEFYRNELPFDPQVLRGVSTPSDEYLPMFSPDNSILFFTRVGKYQAKGDLVAKDVEELTESRRASMEVDFDRGQALPDPFNQGDSYGGVTISVNNKELFVTVCKPVGEGYRNCDIFRTHYDNHMDFGSGMEVWEWTGLEDLGPAINTPDGWESQPSLSADGRTLYFATVREGSRGTDIYSSTRDDKGVWSTAKPLPAPINTDGDDKAPFMHSDSRTLYFASKGHQGIGGYDIFFSKLNEDGTWTLPKNIGHPINTPQDEHGLVVSADGRTAYFASSRFRGVGGLDIYGFALPKDVRPEEILIVKGDVTDDQGRPVKDAVVEITYMDTRKSELLEVDQADGTYAAVLNLRADADVVVTVKKPDHVFDSRVYTLADTVRKGVADADMTVAPIEVGKSYRVNDINYATNSAEITGPSLHILDQLVVFLTENPSVRIAIHGHTDNVGNLADNMTLSMERAFNVMSYLQEHGIDAGRLSFEGFGPNRPVASNDSPEGRARNRRTEFVIVSR